MGSDFFSPPEYPIWVGFSRSFVFGFGLSTLTILFREKDDVTTKASRSIFFSSGCQRAPHQIWAIFEVNLVSVHLMWKYISFAQKSTLLPSDFWTWVHFKFSIKKHVFWASMLFFHSENLHRNFPNFSWALLAWLTDFDFVVWHSEFLISEFQLWWKIVQTQMRIWSFDFAKH